MNFGDRLHMLSSNLQIVMTQAWINIFLDKILKIDLHRLFFLPIVSIDQNICRIGRSQCLTRQQSLSSTAQNWWGIVCGLWRRNSSGWRLCSRLSHRTLPSKHCFLQPGAHIELRLNVLMLVSIHSVHHSCPKALRLLLHRLKFFL